ncbi:hypothetical protein JCM10213v2_008039 [Rhodosporidiobolus nylandii]
MSYYGTPGSTSTSGTNGSYWGGGDGGAFSSSWVTWVSLVIVAGVLLALLFSRYFYIRRAYGGKGPTLRAYFIPPKGIHIRRLGIHIRGPPPRTPREPPPSYSLATGRRRRRRNRQTVGETLGAGGTRLGDRDEDDGWDDEEAAVGGVQGRQEGLPQYSVDVALPGYATGEGSEAAMAEAERIRALGLTPVIPSAATSDNGGGDGDVLPSAAEYEAQSRAARDSPAYPPAAHLSPPSPTSLAAPTPRPSAPQRSHTARSSTFLGTLSMPSFARRAPSPSPTTPTAPSQPEPPRASTSSETLDDRASVSTAATAADRNPLGLRRNSSSASGSSGETTKELGVDGEGGKVVRSSSTVALSRGEKEDPLGVAKKEEDGSR